MRDLAKVDRLVAEWREKAEISKQEAARIRVTIKEPSDAELRCLVRAEMWERCSWELASEIEALKALGVEVGDE